MVAMVSIGAMRLAIEDWRPAGGERSLADYLTGYLKQTALASPDLQSGKQRLVCLGETQFSFTV
jgi:hypothetical protein